MEMSQSVDDKEKASSDKSMEGPEEEPVMVEEKLGEGLLPAEKASCSSSSIGGMVGNKDVVEEEPQTVEATEKGGELQLSRRSMETPWEVGSLGAEKASSSSSMKAEKVSGSSSVLRQEETHPEIESQPPMEETVQGKDKFVKEWWVVDMEEKLSYTDQSPDRWAKHFIFRVPEWIKNMTNSNAYEPWLVSLGPYHHDDANLKPMEEHKRRAVLAVTTRMGGKNALMELASVVENMVDYLQGAYDDLDEQWVGGNTGKFKEMMLTDGCFLLEIIRVFGLISTGKTSYHLYKSNDPVFGMRGFVSFYLALKADVIVMENQLPLLLLKELEEKITGKSLESKEINDLVLNFLSRTYEGNRSSLRLHPLDILHLSFCGEQEENKQFGNWDDTMPSIKELAEAGIHFKKCNTGSVHNIKFQSGVVSMIHGFVSRRRHTPITPITPLPTLVLSMRRLLTLIWGVLIMPIRVLLIMPIRMLLFMFSSVLRMPEIEVNDRTEKEFLNLIAFERLYGSAGSNATAFMIFMDDLIDSEKDVEILRSKGIINNKLSSDIEAAKLFNTLSKGALLNPSSHLSTVRHSVNEHCKKPWNVWRANFIQTYMKNPCVFSAFVASVLLLIATFLQTIYTVMPYYKPRT
ncbi:hypothetical protein PR202_gb13651 [Eleusine coracana subsp. coracana]|uniref:Uncharacterized protein n=1 Tax=Eleusine coracana subsp. coracana TaxID=191504 RepID=A0AAV5ER36_ELECO|nr:hypothetical protein PR202_gb13651 [Eleusine coracana subsp. coracana]